MSPIRRNHNLRSLQAVLHLLHPLLLPRSQWQSRQLSPLSLHQMLRHHRRTLPRRRRFGSVKSALAHYHPAPQHNHLPPLDLSASPVLLLVAFQHLELAEHSANQAAQLEQWVSLLVAQA